MFDEAEALLLALTDQSTRAVEVDGDVIERLSSLIVVGACSCHDRCVPTAPTTPSPFSVPLFRAVWIASLVSNVGSLVQSVGASWEMTAGGASAELVALVQTAGLLPTLFLSLAAGAVADNFDRRWTMVVAQLFMLAVSAALAVAAWHGHAPSWVLLVATFLIACGSALNAPAWQASVRDMVPAPILPGAIAWNGVSFNLARSLGPAFGGLLVAAAGPGAAFLFNAISYAGLIWVLARWHPVLPANPLPRERIAAAMVAGVRYVGLSPDIVRVLIRAFSFGAAAGALPALMPLVAKDLIGGGAATYGLTLGAFGVGAVAGAMLAVRLRAVRSSDFVVGMAAAAMTAGAAGTALSHLVFLTLPALFVAGAGWVAALSTFNTVVQLSSPRWVVGRVVSIYQMANFGGMALGSWLFGRLADGHGVTIALLGAATLQAVGLPLWRLLPLPPKRDHDLDPVGGWRTPQTAIDLTDRSGPVVIEVEVEIEEAKVDAFVALMARRRRLRLRNGARRWSLERDVAKPERWIERFQFATWLDYSRYHARETVSERAVVRELGELRTAGTDISIRRLLARPTALVGQRAPSPGRVIDPVVPQH